MAARQGSFAATPWRVSAGNYRFNTAVFGVGARLYRHYTPLQLPASSPHGMPNPFLFFAILSEFREPPWARETMRLNLYVQGNGVPLIVLHGLLGCSDKCRAKRKRLADYRLHTGAAARFYQTVIGFLWGDC